MNDDPYDAHDNDDDEELELEPLDPEITEHKRRRTEQRAKQAVAAVDINEVFDEQKYSDLEINAGWLQSFRFTTKHLMIVTALLAMLLTVRFQLGGCNAIFFLFVGSVAAGWFYTVRHERQLTEQRAKRKAEIEAMMAGDDPDAPDLGPAVAQLKAEQEKENRPAWKFKFQFSMQQLMIAFTVAAVTLGLTRACGPATMTMLLGFIALAGLVSFAAGYEPPQMVVLGWWMLLLMYLVLVSFTVMFGGAS